ncbi:MAG: VWA domain-containing protein [Planctomycetia bacterium]|nr:VWA domain-containing protein [Planctomycetia bacterium]
MPSFSLGMFALAGVAAAAGPIIVHLMNRRRFCTIDWAAMQFLREAVRQSRRVLHIRDLLLLILRVACLLLFGFAMARPYFTSTGGGSFGAGEPIHAVLLIDDSLSMAYRSTQGTLLDDARSKCRSFIEELPSGSRVAIIPVCADPSRYSLDPTATKQSALEALDAVETVDRKAGLNAALDLAQAALRRLPDMPNKRVVFVTDGQRVNFPAEEATKRLVDEASGLGGDVQVLTLNAGPTDNAWLSDLRAVDGAAVAGADADFLAVVRYEGAARRADVQVSFTVDGKLMQTRVVDLEPNQRREVLFTHRFETAPSAESPRFAVVEVGLSDDRLPDDNQRQTVVPLVSGLSILYVSEHGPSKGEAGRNESAAGRGLWIQRLLAPVVERGDVQPKLVRISHIAASTLTADQLQDARLVVMAGVRTPGERVPLLREYVEQGGRLLITAGEEFDPAAWHDNAWLDGAGILPAPLAPKAMNVSERVPIKPLRLDARTLGHRYFQIEDAPSDELTDLYAAPVFFAAVAADPSTDAVAKLTATETKRIADRRERERLAVAARLVVLPPGKEPPPPPPAPLVRLNWPEPPADTDHDRTPEELAVRTVPTVIGRFDNGMPLFIERAIGRGTILFCSTGLQSSWNTLTMSRAVVVLDRAVRSLLERTLPQRNFDTSQTALVALRPLGSGTYLQLVRPGDRREPIVVDALGDDKYAVVLRDLSRRGVYRIIAQRTDTGSTGDVNEQTLWDLPLAVAGPEQESYLKSLGRDEALPGIEVAHVRRLNREEDLSVAGATISGQNLWKWLMSAVLVCLVAELAVIRFMRPATRTLLPAREIAA